MADRSNTLISEREVIRLYDDQGKEIGMTVGGSREMAYAFTASTRIAKAVAYSQLFGEEVTMRSDISKRLLEEVKERHHLGDNLLFWIKTLVIN